jgi:hypothetical protein
LERWLRRGSCWARGALAAAALGGGPRGAGAAELMLEEPGACVTRDALSFRVERLLGRALSDAEVMALSIRVEAVPAGLEARLEVATPGVAEPGVRTLRSASCNELSESLALAIVVAIGEAEEAPAPTPIPPVVEAASAMDAAPMDPARSASAATGGGHTFAGSAWMIGDTGTLPSMGLGVGVGLELSWPSIALRAIGTLLPEREGTLAAAGSPGVSIGLTAGGALVCVPLRDNPAALSIAACGGWEVGQLWGSGTHVSAPYHQRALWSAARFDVASRWVVPDTAVALELLVTAEAPFTRDDFILKGIGRVHRPANVIGRLGLGVSLAIDR